MVAMTNERRLSGGHAHAWPWPWSGGISPLLSDDVSMVDDIIVSTQTILCQNRRITLSVVYLRVSPTGARHIDWGAPNMRRTDGVDLEIRDN